MFLYTQYNKFMMTVLCNVYYVNIYDCTVNPNKKFQQL